MSFNPYIDDNDVIIEDVHNDLFVLGEIKGKIHTVISAAQRMQEQRAMVKYRHILEETIEKLDDIIAKELDPTVDKAEEGILYYESNC